MKTKEEIEAGSDRTGRASILLSVVKLLYKVREERMGEERRTEGSVKPGGD